MVYALALGSALCGAIGGVLQRIGVEAAPEQHAMRLRLLSYALRRGTWLLGFAFLLMTFVLQATALRFGDLSVVQPVSTTELLFLVGILVVVFHNHIGWREVGGAAMVVVGLGGFLVLAAPQIGKGIPGLKGWGAVSVVVAVVTSVLVAASQRGPRWVRAGALGGGAAMLFAYNASLAKATTTLITKGWGHVFAHWEPYALVVTGFVGFFLLQNALHAGPIAASRSVMVVVNPLASIAIGVFVFHERLRTGGIFVSGEVVALLAMCAGGFVLSQSPLVTGIAVGGGSSEMLGRKPLVLPAFPDTGVEG